MKKIIVVIFVVFVLLLGCNVLPEENNVSQTNVVNNVSGTYENQSTPDPPEELPQNIDEVADYCTGKLTRQIVEDFCQPNREMSDEKVDLTDLSDKWDVERLELLDMKSICGVSVSPKENEYNDVVLVIFEPNDVQDAFMKFAKAKKALKESIAENPIGTTPTGQTTVRIFEEIDFGKNAYVEKVTTGTPSGGEIRLIMVSVILDDGREIVVSVNEANDRRLCSKENLIRLTEGILSEIDN